MNRRQAMKMIGTLAAGVVLAPAINELTSDSSLSSEGFIIPLNVSIIHVQWNGKADGAFYLEMNCPGGEVNGMAELMKLYDAELLKYLHCRHQCYELGKN